jgi:DNA polymerase
LEGQGPSDGLNPGPAASFNAFCAAGIAVVALGGPAVELPIVTDSADRLLLAARQIIETEGLLGGQFMPARRSPLPEIQAGPSVSTPPGLEMTKEQKAAALGHIDLNEVQKCRNCSLAGYRTHTVFGEGDPDAELVFVGEAPGAEEDATGRPFVGRAGELLTKMINAMGLKRQDVYICNMLKCRPPSNRTPSPEEVNCCWHFLARQLEIIRPKVIVALGNPATKGLLDTKVGITQIRGQWQKLPNIGRGLEGIDVMPTFHPAYLLRQYSQENRGKVWSDLQAVMKKLDLGPAKNHGP